MRETLDLVRGAVSTKDLLPVLTHFHIYSGRVQGGNGRVTIDAPCEELAGLDVTVPAKRFLDAVDACEGEPKIKVSDAGRLTLTRAKFRATLPLASHDSFPRSEYRRGEAKQYALPKTFLLSLGTLFPFVGEDASRPWCASVLLRDGYAWATNNVTLARMPIGAGYPVVAIPVFAVEELLRIDREPRKMMATDVAVTFDLGDGIWLKAQLLTGEWPDVSKIMPTKVPNKMVSTKGLAEAVLKVAPFCPDPRIPIIVTGDKGVSTMEGDMCAQVACGALPEARFRADVLLPVLEVAQDIDLSAYPNPSYWRSNVIDGVVVGVR